MLDNHRVSNKRYCAFNVGIDCSMYFAYTFLCRIVTKHILSRNLSLFEQVNQRKIPKNLRPDIGMYGLYQIIKVGSIPKS